MARRRSERVADLLKKEVSKVIEGDLKDPEIGFVTITGVRVSEDLRHARVLVSVLGDDDVGEKSLGALTRARGYIRLLVGRRVRLRFTPEITFKLDRGSPLVLTEGIDEENP